jgi:hypothetical protein
VLANAGLPGVMRCRQGLGREVERQQHAASGYFHEPSLEPPPRRRPGINHGVGPVMTATRPPKGGVRAEPGYVP